MKKILFNLIIIMLICSIFFTTSSIAFNNENETDNKTQTQEQEEQKLEQNNNDIDNTTLQEEKKENIEIEEEKVEQEKSVETTEDTDSTENMEITENIEIPESVESEENTVQLRATKSINKQIIENGIYEICSVADQNKVINAENNNYSNLTNINLGTNKKLKRQKFYITYDSEKEAYIIKSMQGNQVLDVDGGRKQDSTNVQLYEYNGTLAQQWEIKEIEKNEYTIFSKDSDKCIDIKWRSYTRWYKYPII